MTHTNHLEDCSDCLATLPKLDGEGQAHPYIGASPSCWTIFSNLWNGGDPPIAPFPYQPLILDAYCVQHHGTPSPQAIQSVAIHAICLYGVLSRGHQPDQTMWIRNRLLRDMPLHRHERYTWLTPPEFETCITVADVVKEVTPEGRAEKAQAYIEEVWSLWRKPHGDTLAYWYEKYVTERT